MDKKILAEQVVAHMIAEDSFSKWLGIEILAIEKGYSKIKMQVRKEMLNGFGIAHGGIAFSLADSAFAFACNNQNNLSLALDTSIHFIKQVQLGDELIAEAMELHDGKNTGYYQINIYNQGEKLIGQFKGTCYRTGKALIKQ